MRERRGGDYYYYYSGGWRLLLRLLGRQRGRAERLEVLVTAGGSASKSPLPSASPTFPLLSRLSPRLASLCLPPTSSHNCVLVPARLLPLPGTRHCFRHRLDACSSTASACLYSRTHARALSADESCFRLHLQKLPTWTRLGEGVQLLYVKLNYATTRHKAQSLTLLAGAHTSPAQQQRILGSRIRRLHVIMTRTHGIMENAVM